MKIIAQDEVEYLTADTWQNAVDYRSHIVHSLAVTIGGMVT